MFSRTRNEIVTIMLSLLVIGCAGSGIQSSDSPTGNEPDQAVAAAEKLGEINNASWPEVIDRAEYYSRLASKCKIYYTLGRPARDSAGWEACKRLRETEPEARANNRRARELAAGGDKSGVDEYVQHVESMARDFADIRHAQQSLQGSFD